MLCMWTDVPMEKHTPQTDCRVPEADRSRASIQSVCRAKYRKLLCPQALQQGILAVGLAANHLSAALYLHHYLLHSCEDLEFTS